MKKMYLTSVTVFVASGLIAKAAFAASCPPDCVAPVPELPPGAFGLIVGGGLAAFYGLRSLGKRKKAPKDPKNPS